jgi:cytochrome c oxidase subunit II
VADTRSDYLHVQQIYLPIAIAVFVLILGAVLFAIVRYRRRDPDEFPEQKNESKLEYVWIALLVSVAAFLVGWTFHTEDREDPVANAPALKVHVIASQWKWRFDYAGRGARVVGTETKVPTLVVPVGVPVEFTLTSPDVIHAFWIPAQRFKRDAFPGTTTRFDLTWNKPGFDRGGRCAEFCGIGHDTMLFNIRALPRGQFDSWLAAQ